MELSGYVEDACPLEAPDVPREVEYACAFGARDVSREVADRSGRE